MAANHKQQRREQLSLAQWLQQLLILGRRPEAMVQEARMPLATLYQPLMVWKLSEHQVRARWFLITRMVRYLQWKRVIQIRRLTSQRATAMELVLKSSQKFKSSTLRISYSKEFHRPQQSNNLIIMLKRQKSLQRPLIPKQLNNSLIRGLGWQ